MTSRAQPTRSHSTRSIRALQRPRPLVSTMFAGEEASAEGAAAATEGEPAPAAAAAAVGGEGGEGEAEEEKEPEKPLTEMERAQKAKLEEIERLRSKEKFITAATGDYECLQCSFVYKPTESGQGALAGTQFDDLPSTWLCPVCKAPKDTFVAQTKTIAGFEDNLNYGFGANKMTGGQKNLLIFGSLAAFFVLFLAGYALE